MILIRLHAVNKRGRRTDLALRLDLIEAIEGSAGLTTVYTVTGNSYRVDETDERVATLMAEAMQQAKATSNRW